MRLTSKHAVVAQLGGYDLRPDLGSYQRTREWITEARFPFGEETEENLDVGVARMSLAIDGLWNDVAAGSVRGLAAAELAPLPFVFNGENGAVLSKCAMMHASRITSMSEPSQGGQFVKFQAQVSNSSGHARSNGILLRRTTETANLSVVIDTGAGEGNTGGLWTVTSLRNFDLGSASALAVKVSESASGSGPWVQCTLQTFSSDTAGFDAKSDDSAVMTVGRYLKLEATWTGGAGGGSTADIVVAVSRL